MHKRHLQRIVVGLSTTGLLTIGVAIRALQARQRQYALDRRLIAALEKNDAAQGLALVNAGADPNTPYEPPPPPSLRHLLDYMFHRPTRPRQYNPSAFQIACCTRYDLGKEAFGPDSRPLVEAMLRHRAKIDARDSYGISSLGWAAYREHQKTVEVLLKNGADVNVHATDGSTPLEYVAEGSPSIVRLLLDHGADVNARNNEGDTPLIALMPSARPEIVQILLEHGANVNAHNKDGETPLISGCSSNSGSIRLLLRHGADIDARDNNGDTPLLMATRRSAAIDTIKLLIAHGADVNARNKKGDSPLIEASSDTSTDMVRLLLAHGAVINAHDDTGVTPLIAAATDLPSTVRLLLEHGAKVNAQDQSGMTALYAAVAEPSTKAEVVRLLLQHGADPNLRPKVPLLTSQAFSNTALQHGSSPTVRMNGIPSALQLALTNKRADLAALLMATGAKK